MKNKDYTFKKVISTEDYKALISKLYVKYPQVIKAKISEYEKTFSLNNPFFKYGKIESYFLIDGEEVVGHVAAIIDDRFGSIGVLGFFECNNNQNYANSLFNEVNNYLKDAGKQECRGPINISVWQNFRVSYPEGNLPFCLEPFTLEYYRDLFLAYNFIVNHQNVTTVDTIEQSKLKSYEVFYNDSIKSGYSYELLNKDNAQKSILNIYLLMNQIFEGGYSFYKISEEEFIYSTQQYTEVPKPHYIFIVKDIKQELVGFFFAIPDLYNPKLKRVVLKTMGIAPKFRGLGLAEAMFYFVYKKAREDGFKDLLYSTRELGNDRIKSLTGESPVLYRKYEVYKKNIV
jgi:GNAT superfamily N-acetyltransferase